jgi:hypothetical protein
LNFGIAFGVSQYYANPPHRRTLLCVRGQRPRRSGAADKCYEFPSPHGFAHAKDYIGYEKNITFLDLQ